MVTWVRLLESFEAGLYYDIYVDHIVQSLIQLPGTIKKFIFEIVLVLSLRNVQPH